MSTALVREQLAPTHNTLGLQRSQTIIARKGSSNSEQFQWSGLVSLFLFIGTGCPPVLKDYSPLFQEHISSPEIITKPKPRKTKRPNSRDEQTIHSSKNLVRNPPGFERLEISTAATNFEDENYSRSSCGIGTPLLQPAGEISLPL
jgi:hypothetical protein